MNVHSHTHFAKAVFFVALIATSVVTLLIPTIDAEHGTDGITVPLTNGTNQISFRDISNTNPHSFNATADTSTTSAGFITITVTDVDANLKLTEADVILASATSTSSGSVATEFSLTETLVDSGTFSGQLLISPSTQTGKLKVSNNDEITYLHPELPEQGRLSAEINVNATTNVVISDFLINTDLRSDRVCPASIVLHPVEIQISDIDANDVINVTMSYANTGLTDAEAALYEVVF